MKEIAIFMWWALIATGATVLIGLILIACFNSIKDHFTKP